MLDHRGDHLGLDAWVLVSVGDDGRVAAAGEGHLGTRSELGEERVPKIVYDEADQPDVGAPEVRGRAVVNVVEGAHRFLDFVPCRRAHQRAVLQHERDRGLRNAGMPRHVHDRRPFVHRFHLCFRIALPKTGDHISPRCPIRSHAVVTEASSAQRQGPVASEPAICRRAGTPRHSA